jgi:divalent metal cation (Fe/Co/Zn/Cd) transporter
MSTAQRYAEAESASRTGLWGNMLLAFLKGIAGSLTGSKALLADAFRTGAEAARDAAAWAGLRASRNDRSGSNGVVTRKESRRGELATPILMSVILLIVGLEIAISAIRDIADGVEKAPHWSALAAIIAGFVVQRLLLPPKDRQMGLYCSLASLIGAVVAIGGGWLQLPALYYFDPAAALVIAVIVMTSGYRIATGMAMHVDKAEAAEENSEELMQLVQRMAIMLLRI